MSLYTLTNLLQPSETGSSLLMLWAFDLCKEYWNQIARITGRLC